MRKMKDSRIEWIGKIPETWGISKLKYIGKYINGYAFKPSDWSDTGRKIIRIQDLTGSYDNPNYYDGDIDSKYVIKNGDILVSWAATLDAFIWHKDEGLLNQHIFKAIPDKKIIDYNFFFWMIKIAMENMNNDNKHGIFMQHVTLDVFNNFTIPLPKISEQSRIATFLTSRCDEINAVLEKTRASIKEYKKLKLAVITQAVTKGIRGDRPMKDSGSIWFGNIPVDWDMKKIKYLFHIKKDIAGQEGYTVLSITQKGIMPKDLSKNEGQLAESYSHYQLVNPGDYAMNHMDLLTGWVDISKYTGVTSPDYRVFVLDDLESNNRSFYLYLMQMCYSNRIFYGLGQGVSGMGRWRLQADKFLNFSIVVPSKDEQQEIADYLDAKCAEIDNLISKKEQYISEIENYKKSLIYEYVTGKKECPAMVQNEDVSNAYPYFPAPVHASSARFAQAVLMSKILEESSKGMGRVKLEKTLFTIENHIGFNFDTEYLREAAGPLDASIYECEKIITRRNKWFSMKTSSYGVSYAPTNDVDKYKKYYAKYFSEYNSEIERIIDVFRNYTTEQAEIIATLFAAWNDAIIDKKQFTDDDIVDDVLNNWHESKRRFPRQVWLRAMNEIRKNHIIPKGYGKHTVMKEMQ